MNKIIFAILMLPLSVLAETPENQLIPYAHSVAFTVSGGDIGEMLGVEYEYQFLPSWSINLSRMEGKELFPLQDEFSASGISLKKSIALSERWSVHASLGLNRNNIYYEFREPCYPNCDFDPETTGEPDLFLRKKGDGKLYSIGIDCRVTSRLFIGVRYTEIDLGKYPGDSSLDYLRLSYHF